MIDGRADCGVAARADRERHVPVACFDSRHDLTLATIDVAVALVRRVAQQDHHWSQPQSPPKRRYPK